MGRNKKGGGPSLIDLIFGGGKRITTGGHAKSKKHEGKRHIGIRNGGDTNKSPGVGYIVGGPEYYRPPREPKR